MLDGETEREKAVVDMLLDQAMDLRNGVVRLCYNKDYVSLHLIYILNILTLLLLKSKLKFSYVYRVIGSSPESGRTGLCKLYRAVNCIQIRFFE